MPLLQDLATLFIGFSLFSALLLLITHFSCAEYHHKPLPLVAGIALLASLVGLQLTHYYFLHYSLHSFLQYDELLLVPFYNLCLFTVAPAFYFYSKELLKANNPSSPFQWLHLLPILVAPFITYQLAQFGSFMIGGGYVAWLAYTIFQLRDQRSRFKQEISALAIMFVIAITVLVAGLIMPLISKPVFYSYYAINIGLAFFVTVLILLKSPSLTTEVSEAVQASYIASTLENIDVDKVLQALEQLMQEDKLYTHEDLKLNTLADAVDLSPHQLSELINTRLGVGFSHYLRGYRINAAKQLLIEEPHASVLAIGLEVGFTSQSNFYAAFKQLESMAPGQFRKHNV